MNIVDYFIKLYKEKSQLALLTWAYLAITVVFVVLAGIFALFNQAFGLSVLIVPFVAIIALCVNVTAWALIRYLLDGIISRREIAKKAAALAAADAAAAKATENAVIVAATEKTDVAKTEPVKADTKKRAKKASKKSKTVASTAKKAKSTTKSKK